MSVSESSVTKHLSFASSINCVFLSTLCAKLAYSDLQARWFYALYCSPLCDHTYCDGDIIGSIGIMHGIMLTAQVNRMKLWP